MPKLRESPRERMNRAFMAGLRYGQAMRGEDDKDTAQLMPKGRSTYYNRLKDLDKFTREELMVIGPRYFNDRMWCEAWGLEYHGSTPE